MAMFACHGSHPGAGPHGVNFGRADHPDLEKRERYQLSGSTAVLSRVAE